MIKKLFKALLVVSLIAPIQVDASKKSKTLCSLLVQKCLGVEGNEVIGGNLAVLGTLTVAGVPLNNLVGLAGAIGPAGAAGAVGPVGPPGTPGIPGLGGILGWGYIYNLGAQTVASEAPLVFDSNGPLLGITHATPSASIGIVSAGTYTITFTVTSNNPNQFTIFVNGVANTSTTYGSGAGTQTNIGQAILTLGAGDVITLVNHSTGSGIILQTLAGGTAVNVNASILIERIA